LVGQSEEMDYEEEDFDERQEQMAYYASCPRGRDSTADCHEECEDEEDDCDAKSSGRSPRRYRNDEDAGEDEDEDEEDGYSRRQLYGDPSIESFVAKQVVDSVLGTVSTSRSPPHR
jgi:hypothetical protein